MGSYLIVYNLMILLFLLYLSIKKTSISIFSPTSLSVIGLLVMYVLRPIYILQNGFWGGTPLLVKSIKGFNDIYDEAMILSSMFITTVAIPMILFLLNHKPRKNKLFFDSNFKKIVVIIHKVLLGVSLLILAIPFMNGITVNEYLHLLSMRSVMFKTFYGHFGAFVEMFFFLYTSVAVLKIIINMVEVKNITWTVALVVLVLMLLGGRSNILFFLISIGGAKLYLSDKINKIYYAYFFVAVLIFGISYRVITRDLYFQQNKDRNMTQILLESMSQPHEFLVGGFDFVQIDALMTILADNRGQKDLLYGSTIAACVTSPIPRAFWEDKPKGAMTYFTKTYYNSHFLHSEGGELVASWLVESILNFGYIGILFAGFTVFYLLSFLELKFDNCRSVVDLGILCILSPRPFNILKSDLFNNFMAIGKVLIIPIIIKIFIKRKRSNKTILTTRMV